MSDRVTIEEQDAQDLRRRRPTNLVLPTPQVRPMSEAESTALQGFTQSALQPDVIQMPAVPAATHTAHMRDNYDVRASARVAERWIVWDMVIFGTITGALAILIYYRLGGDQLLYGLTWLLVWGTVSYVAMHRNRSQAYAHSPTGVARLEQQTQATMHDRTAQVEEHRIDVQADVAKYAIDAHVTLLEKRWRMELGNHERLTD